MFKCKGNSHSRFAQCERAQITREVLKTRPQLICFVFVAVTYDRVLEFFIVRMKYCYSWFIINRAIIRKKAEAKA